MPPFFSVIIPLYNRASRIVRALDSLASQTFKDFETIIVDDASTDNSYQIACEFNLPNKTVIHNEKNSERCITRNKGIAVAKGMYICFLDSDDYHLPNHLQTLHDYIVEKECPTAAFFTNAWDESEFGERAERCCPDFEYNNRFSYFLRYTPNPQRWAIHHSIMNIIQFDPNVVIAEDLDLLLRVAASQFPIYQIPKRTTVYVAATDSFTHSDLAKAEKELLYFRRIFQKEELRKLLPKEDTNRLLSQCYFHLMEKSFSNKQKSATLKNGLLSFWLCPKGYNGKTNKIVAASCIHSIPLFGTLLQYIKRETHR